MARAGDVIVNPLTGEWTRFHRTEAETAGESVLIECWVQPGGTVTDAVGRDQHERVEVLQGMLGARLDAQPVVAGRANRRRVMPDPTPALERRQGGVESRAPRTCGAGLRRAAPGRDGRSRGSRDEPQPERKP